MPLDRSSLTKGRLAPVFMLVAAIWAVQIVNFVLGYRLNIWFGLEPRDFGGLIGIPLSPFLHAGFAHTIANTVPMLILGGMVAMITPRRFVSASVLIVLCSGLAVWLLARGGPRVHVGASGLIFGYFGFLVALGVLERSLLAILGAVIAVVLYGGMIFGILPTNTRVSWEGHLFGFLAGIGTAWLLRKQAHVKP